MKTIEDLKQFYDTALINDLNVLEEKRKKIAHKLVFIGIVLLGIAGILFFPLQQYTDGILWCFVILFVVCLAIWSAIFDFLRKDYTKEFEVKIIHKVVRFLDESLIYSKNSCILEPTFKASQIFQEKHDEYRGHSLVSGEIDENIIEFSRITAKRIVGGRTRVFLPPVFCGLFIVGKFNKSFSGRTVVMPHSHNILSGTAGKILSPWERKRDPLIKLDYPEFEQLFVIHSDNPTHTRDLLQIDLMRKIIDFKKKKEKLFYLSFIGSNIFVAVSEWTDPLTANLFVTLPKFEPIQSYFENIQFVMGIVDELNSNSRIWSKL